ncbi:protein ninH [Martelella alba]|uniref:Protein ninH n=1 Tax=Martelella alba TaxID=2590451 RepID=A0ABY2SJZ3_9HYPH|nr:protein ninH [Martelella alba]
MPWIEEVVTLAITSIPESLEANHGIVSATAKSLHINRNTVRKYRDDYLMKRHVIVNGRLYKLYQRGKYER